MEIVSLCPFRAATLVWQARPSEWTLTVVVKGTFQLVADGEASVAARQDPIGADRHWDDDPEGSLYAPCDRAPFKPRADVLLVGHAFASEPTTHLTARLCFGELDKTVEIVGDRLWERTSRGLAVAAPEEFVCMPMSYERAPLGPDNPVGIDATAAPIAGALAMPNLTGAFGPIDPTWRGRLRGLSLAATDWAHEVEEGRGATAGPAPPGLDLAFFNTAPADQQLDLLRPSAPIVLEGLHPDCPRIESHLPPLRPRVHLADPSSRAPREVALRCDTLWIETDHGVAVATWRGITTVPTADIASLGRLLVVGEAPGKRLRPERIAELLSEPDPRRAPLDEADVGEHPLSVRHDALKTLPPPPSTATPPADRPRSEPPRRRATVTGLSALHAGLALPFRPKRPQPS